MGYCKIRGLRYPRLERLRADLLQSNFTGTNDFTTKRNIQKVA